MLKNLVYESVVQALSLYLKECQMEDSLDVILKNIKVEKPRDEQFGDFSINISFLAKYLKKPPVHIAQEIALHLNNPILYTNINIVNGFINFQLTANSLNDVLAETMERQEHYGSHQIQGSENILIEYISANPTGPMHIGHGRWAVLGSSLENLLKFYGEKVTTEFYINDSGTQMQILGKSLWFRLLEARGIDVQIPEPGTEEAKSFYPGEYVIAMAQDFICQQPTLVDTFIQEEQDIQNPSFSTAHHLAHYAKSIIIQEQKNLLDQLGVRFNCWYSEQDLHASGKVESILAVLTQKGNIYEKDQALWFKSSNYFDDSDRVLRKSDGHLTYLTADIAYHYEKYQRGYNRLINIWGADHHGYIPRMKSAVKALGYSPDSLEILLGQLVRIVKDGKSDRMGKRKTMVTLKDLVDDVGIDATRYWMVMKSPNTTLEFDVDLATSRTNDNPVFYVQYAHARCCSILRQLTTDRNDIFLKKSNPPVFTEQGIQELLQDKTLIQYIWSGHDIDQHTITKELILKIDSFKEVIKEAACTRNPHFITNYLQELSACFHSFYGKCRILNEDIQLMKGRIILIYAVKTVIKIGLQLIGVSAPHTM